MKGSKITEIPDLLRDEFIKRVGETHVEVVEQYGELCIRAKNFRGAVAMQLACEEWHKELKRTTKASSARAASKRVAIKSQAIKLKGLIEEQVA